MDLHIHTCLSPCGESNMVPSRIVAAALAAGLDGIAITDHNCAANVTAVQEVGRGQGLAVLGGMEITTCEEVHVLAWFDDAAALGAMQELVMGRLDGTNDPDYFGNQWVVNAADEIVEELTALLIGATDMTIDEVVDAVHAHGGLALASHIDRPSFSVVSQLGFVPPQVPFDGVELSRPAATGEGGAWQEGPMATVLPTVTFSDAHQPEDVGRSTTRFRLASVSVGEISKALRGEEGRHIVGNHG